MTKWEYRTEHYVEDDYELDELGEEGWELVAVVAVGLHSDSFRYYFKRPVGKPADTKG